MIEKSKPEREAPSSSSYSITNGPKGQSTKGEVLKLTAEERTDAKVPKRPRE